MANQLEILEKKLIKTVKKDKKYYSLKGKVKNLNKEKDIKRQREWEAR